MLDEAGFTDISITRKGNSDEIIKGWNIGENSKELIFSGYVRAVKP